MILFFIFLVWFTLLHSSQCSHITKLHSKLKKKRRVTIHLYAFPILCGELIAHPLLQSEFIVEKAQGLGHEDIVFGNK